jgi:hypothetical protein
MFWMSRELFMIILWGVSHYHYKEKAYLRRT